MDLSIILKAARALRRDVAIGFDADGAIAVVETSDVETVVRAERDGATPVGWLHCPGSSFPKCASVDGWRATMAANGTNGTIKIGPAAVAATLGEPAAFPAPDRSLPLPDGTLSAVLARIGMVVPSDDRRYGLNGIHVETFDAADTGAADWRIRFVATDGSRLHWFEAPAPSGWRELDVFPTNKLLPLALAKLGAAIGATRIGFRDGWAALRSDVDGWTWTSAMRLVDGEFPAYRSVLPDRNGLRWATVDAADLATAIGAVQHCAIDQARTCRINLCDGWATLSTRGVDVGTAAARIRATLEDGCPSVFGVNLGFLEQAIKAAGPGPLRLGFRIADDCQCGEYLSPITLDCQDGAWSGIIMPIRLDSGSAPAPEAPEVQAPVKAARKAAPRPVAAPKRASKATPSPAPESPVKGAPCSECAELRARLATERTDHAAAMDRARKDADRVATKLQDRIVAAESRAVEAETTLAGYQASAIKLTRALEEARERIGWLERDLAAARAARSSPAPAPTTAPNAPASQEAEPEPTAAIPARRKLVLCGGNLRAPAAIPTREPAPSAAPAPATFGSARMTADEARASYEAARRALASGSLCDLAAAYEGLPPWAGKRADAYRAAIVDALEKARAIAV